MKLSRGEKITVVDSSGAEIDIMTSTGLLTADNITLNAGGIIDYSGGAYSKGYVETLNWSSGGVTPSTMTNYGISFISMTGTDPSTSPATVTLAAPLPGVEKTIVLDSTAAYANTIDIDLGAGVGQDGSTTNRFIGFSTLATQNQCVRLIGLSTSEWAVMGVNSTIGSYGAATGIRALTAARTS